jgi:hypothetical protein
MKKQIIFLMIFLILTVGFLSGCEQNNNGTKIDLSKLKLVNHTVEIRDDMTGEEYRQITGYVINNAGKSFEMIEINVTFFDKDNNSIITKQSYIKNMANKETREFSTVYHSLTNHYYIVDWDNIKFDISVFKD